MERLFTKGGSYTEQATVISTYVANLIEEAMNLYPDVDMRDLTLVVLNAAQDATTSVALDRKED